MAQRKSIRPEQVTWEPIGANQVLLRDTIRNKRITFAHGPAGTGKTMVGVCTGLEELAKGIKNGGVDGIVVTRPLVTAGESFGYLPGTLDEKIDPYMKAVWDIIIDCNIPNMQELKDGEFSPIQCVPLELMRGQTFKNKYVIIDEAQNVTDKQIEMCMTRLGMGSRMVLCGDVNQIDLNAQSGFRTALEIFKHEPQFGMVEFSLDDIQREGIVRTVIEKFAYYRSFRSRMARTIGIDEKVSTKAE